MDRKFPISGEYSIRQENTGNNELLVKLHTRVDVTFYKLNLKTSTLGPIKQLVYGLGIRAG